MFKNMFDYLHNLIYDNSSIKNIQKICKKYIKLI